jgi:adenylate kinase family enzyme
MDMPSELPTSWCDGCNAIHCHFPPDPQEHALASMDSCMFCPHSNVEQISSLSLASIASSHASSNAQTQSHAYTGLIHKAMKSSNVNKFLIDGFPRALDQAEAFESSVCDAKAMLFLDCPEHVMEQRLLGRAQGRSDDNPATIKKRFEVYLKHTMPVVDKFKDDGRLCRVDATRTPEEVFEDVSRVVKDIEGAIHQWQRRRGLWVAGCVVASEYGCQTCCIRLQHA